MPFFSTRFHEYKRFDLIRKITRGVEILASSSPLRIHITYIPLSLINEIAHMYVCKFSIGVFDGEKFKNFQIFEKRIVNIRKSENLKIQRLHVHGNENRIEQIDRYSCLFRSRPGTIYRKIILAL